jgi:hypothetical protein
MKRENNIFVVVVSKGQNRRRRRGRQTRKEKEIIGFPDRLYFYCS